jgi:hypothetical protein
LLAGLSRPRSGRPSGEMAELVEGGRLEIYCTLTGTGGSNPSLSATGDQGAGRGIEVPDKRNARPLAARRLRTEYRGEMTELVEGARLEIVCTPKGYRGFESHSLRHVSGRRASGPSTSSACEARQGRPPGMEEAGRYGSRVLTTGGPEPRQVRKEATVRCAPVCQGARLPLPIRGELPREALACRLPGALHGERGLMGAIVRGRTLISALIPGGR